MSSSTRGFFFFNGAAKQKLSDTAFLIRSPIFDVKLTLQKPSSFSSTCPRSLRSFRVACGAAAGACCVDVVVAVAAGEWSVATLSPTCPAFAVAAATTAAAPPGGGPFIF